MRKNWFKVMGLMALTVAVFGMVAAVAASPVGPLQTLILGTHINPIAATAEVGEDIMFVADIEPESAHMPITYTWEVEGAAGLIIHPNVANLTDTLTYNWPQVGTYTVIVTPSNILGEGPSAMATATISAAADAPDMVVSVSGPATAMGGSPVTYTVSYSNTGAGPAADVTASIAIEGMTGVMPVPESLDIGTVNAGENDTQQYVITPPATFGGMYTTTVTIVAQGDSDLTNNADSAMTTVTRTVYNLYLPTLMRNF
jgi:uncharacterized repeat protein (TIGR01451 family)